VRAARRWQALGATHLCLNSVVKGTPPQAQLDTAVRMKHVIVDAIGC
jgi:hypothetical protein